MARGEGMSSHSPGLFDGGGRNVDLLLKYKYYLIAAAAVILLTLFTAFMKRRKKRRNEAEISQLHRRNEALSDALRNPMAKERQSVGADGPLEISWDENAVNEAGQAAGGLTIELTELSAYSRKKYAFRADKPISIGSGNENRMVVFKDGVAAKHCVITTAGGRPCVCAVPGCRALLHRGKKTAIISENGVFLNNGDQVEIGTAMIQFRAFKA